MKQIFENLQIVDKSNLIIKILLGQFLVGSNYYGFLFTLMLIHRQMLADFGLSCFFLHPLLFSQIFFLVYKQQEEKRTMMVCPTRLFLKLSAIVSGKEFWISIGIAAAVAVVCSLIFGGFHSGAALLGVASCAVVAKATPNFIFAVFCI
ncbi:hypothetical protein BDA99DRAFT_534912 [Phascolomyces articulosus]|uniref:Uncharacterized protein n=1 Tax=Phascolomyces articulosus TaxID=60185 RepID=A0AAD5PG46_9FUNG|nr:hypothetical protein BDA99DRAFT_534912 [Phascolomyces articulosus]